VPRARQPHSLELQRRDRATCFRWWWCVCVWLCVWLCVALCVCCASFVVCCCVRCASLRRMGVCRGRVAVGGGARSSPTPTPTNPHTQARVEQPRRRTANRASALTLQHVRWQLHGVADVWGAHRAQRGSLAHGARVRREPIRLQVRRGHACKVVVAACACVRACCVRARAWVRACVCVGGYMVVRCRWGPGGARACARVCVRARACALLCVSPASSPMSSSSCGARAAAALLALAVPWAPAAADAAVAAGAGRAPELLL
jgi:hypothetical protein